MPVSSSVPVICPEKREVSINVHPPPPPSHTRIRFFFAPIIISYGAERFEDGASQINKSDMFYGDDGTISDADLEHIDEVTMKNVQYVKMEMGDVVLLDNYKCMHGRNVFDGTRKHGVAWFEGWEGEEEMRRTMADASDASSSSSSSSRRNEEAAVPFYASSSL